MKFQILFLTILAITYFAGAQDISNLLSDKRYVHNQIDCILDRSRCDLVGRRIKQLLPEAVYNHCRRCTPRQMSMARMLIGFMKQNHPNEWKAILQHYSQMRHYAGLKRLR